MNTRNRHTPPGVITLNYVGRDNKRTHQSGRVYGVGGGSTNIMCGNDSCKDNRQKKGK